MSNHTLIIAALTGGVAVALGAFGAHGLKTMIGPDQLPLWEKAVQYQFYHVFAMLACGILLKQNGGALYKTASWFFMAGIILFSGSLYLLATRDLTGIPSGILGPVTPLGGVSFIIGWALMLKQAVKR